MNDKSVSQMQDNIRKQAETYIAMFTSDEDRESLRRLIILLKFQDMTNINMLCQEFENKKKFPHLVNMIRNLQHVLQE